MKKKILLTLVIFVAVFAVASVSRIVLAGTSHNTTGWLWGGSEESPDTVINGNETGLGMIWMNSTSGGGTYDYGVNIPLTDGPVTGYAWSENLGYINFAPTGPYPQAPDYSVKRVGNRLMGWARFEEIRIASEVGNSGGWSGWILTEGAGYGVTIDSATGKLGGHAWSNELGWIDFSGAVVTPQIAPIIDSFSANPPIIELSLGETFSSLSDADRTVQLQWTLSGGAATSCTASCESGNCLGLNGWSGPQTFATGNNSGSFISTGAGSEATVRITCSNTFGSNYKEIKILVGCYDGNCSSGTNCSRGNFRQSNSYTCTGCAIGSMCPIPSTGSIGNYREVAP